jgi:hypothetical protein
MKYDVDYGDSDGDNSLVLIAFPATARPTSEVRQNDGDRLHKALAGMEARRRTRRRRSEGLDRRRTQEGPEEANTPEKDAVDDHNFANCVVCGVPRGRLRNSG